MARTPYGNPKAIACAKQYCGKKDYACGRYLNGGRLSDGAHFIAHCLAAGGMTVANDDPNTAFCPAGRGKGTVRAAMRINQQGDNQ